MPWSTSLHQQMEDTSVKILLYFDHCIVTSFHLARCDEMVQFSMTQGPDAIGESDIKLVQSFIFLSMGDCDSTFDISGNFF